MFSANEFEDDRDRREARALATIARYEQRAAEGDRRAFERVVSAHVDLGFEEGAVRAYFEHLGRPRASVTELRAKYEAVVASHEDPDARRFLVEHEASTGAMGSLCASRAANLERVELLEEGQREILARLHALGGMESLRQGVAALRGMVRGESKVMRESVEAIVRAALADARQRERAAKRKGRR